METLEIKTSIHVQKSAHEVFEGIVNPDKMCNYFIAKSTGRMETGKELIWQFPEFDTEFPVSVDKVEQDRYISFYWDSEDGKKLLAEITLEPKDDTITKVIVTEKAMENNAAGIKWLKGNTEGWANFLACLKAYLEYGINLRKGAFYFTS